MDVALADATLQIARLSDLTPDLLTLVERILISINSRDGSVSMQTVQVESGGQLAKERLEALFFALVRAGVLTCLKRDRRGYLFDSYSIRSDHLHQIIHDAAMARYAVEQSRKDDQQSGRVKLIATVPDNLPLDPRVQTNIPSLAATLHRMITEADREVVILNPFFEQTGFDRLASALLAAAKHDVSITIITWQLTDPISLNHQVVGSLAKQVFAEGLGNRFSFYEYQRSYMERIVLASHAKVLMTDGERAYIGSANLTEYGMARSVEIGVLVEGPEMILLRQVLEAILRSDLTKPFVFESIL